MQYNGAFNGLLVCMAVLGLFGLLFYFFANTKPNKTIRRCKPKVKLRREERIKIEIEDISDGKL